MPIKSIEEEGKLTLEIDGREYTYLKEAMKKWSFKDPEGMMRFAITLLWLNENKHFTVNIDGFNQDIQPLPTYLVSA